MKEDTIKNQRAVQGDAYGHVRARLRRERRGRPRRQPVNGGRISHAVISALMVGLASQAVFAADESTLSIRLTSPLGRIGTPGTVRVVAQLTTPPVVGRQKPIVKWKQNENRGSSGKRYEDFDHICPYCRT